MTDWVQVLVVALIQGITEFLPVSSSAHLILPAQIWGWIDQGLLFDVVVHAGTLCAVLWYFRDTMITGQRASCRVARGINRNCGLWWWRLCPWCWRACC